MPLIFRRLFPGFPNFIAIRRMRQRAASEQQQTDSTSSSQSGSSTAVTDENPSSTAFRSSELVDGIRLVVPVVQAAAGFIPVAGPRLKAAIDVLLQVIQIADTTNRNKAGLVGLSSRVRELLDFVSRQPEPQDDVEAQRRADLTTRLETTSEKIKQMNERRAWTFAYASTTQDIAGCSADIQAFLLEYALSDLAVIKGQNEAMRSKVAQILLQQEQMLSNLVFIRGRVTLIDAAGHTHDVPLTCCGSFEQLKYMALALLHQPDLSGASVQRRYIESGKFDFCIDRGEQVEQLISGSMGWQNIEPGMTIVMRVIFEQMSTFSLAYNCHLCGASNVVPYKPGGWLTDGSINCCACKGRFQISSQQDQVGRSGPENDPIDEETKHCIRNFRVTQIVADIGDQVMVVNDKVVCVADRLVSLENRVANVIDCFVKVIDDKADIDSRVAGVDNRATHVIDNFVEVIDDKADIDSRVVPIKGRIDDVADRVVGIENKVAYAIDHFVKIIDNKADSRVAGVDNRVANVIDDFVEVIDDKADIDSEVVGINDRVVDVADTLVRIDNRVAYVIDHWHFVKVIDEEVDVVIDGAQPSLVSQ